MRIDAPVYDSEGFECSEKEYNKLLKNIEEDHTSIEHIGSLVSVLQYYVYKRSIFESSVLSSEEIITNKQKALKKIIDVIQGIKDNEYLTFVYLNILAQSNLMLGNWDESIDCYFKILELPYVSNVPYDNDYYCGELENVAKIIHNICCIYHTAKSDEHQAEKIKNSFKYVYDLEEQRTYRLIKNNPNLESQFISNNVRLNDYEAVIYIDDSLMYKFGGKILNAQFLDAYNSKEPATNTFDSEYYLFDNIDEFSIVSIDNNCIMSISSEPECENENQSVSLSTDSTIISKIGERKYNSYELSFEECKQLYNYYNNLMDDEYKDTYSASCSFVLMGKKYTGCMTVNIKYRRILFEYKEDGHECSYVLSATNRLLSIKTVADSSIIELDNHISVTINSNVPLHYNMIVALLMYADFIFENGDWEEPNGFSCYKEINNIEINDLIDVLEDNYFHGIIKPINIDSAIIEEYDECGNIITDEVREIYLCLGKLNNHTYTFESTTYEEAINDKQSMWIDIELEDLKRYSKRIDSIEILKNDDDYAIFIKNKYSKSEGTKLEFYNEEDYNVAIKFLYIAMLNENYLNYNTQNEIAYDQNISKKNIPIVTNNPYDKLNALIGLEEIKSDVNNLVNLVKMQIRRKEQGLKPVPVSLHLVFSGNPGTGKTTIARILADIYKEIGILSKGQLVEVDRSGLVAGYVGQTAIKTQEKINEALGGILFIDEAYTLVKDGNDYGQEAIDTILKAMEDHRDDFIVIVAGYTDLMQNFINSNPGLKSRFNKYIDFPDYSADELIEIFHSMCNEYQYTLTPNAEKTLQEVVFDMEKNKDNNFANARDIRNLFEMVITKQATRLSQEINENIMEIDACDF